MRPGAKRSSRIETLRSGSTRSISRAAWFATKPAASYHSTLRTFASTSRKRAATLSESLRARVTEKRWIGDGIDQQIGRADPTAQSRLIAAVPKEVADVLGNLVPGVRGPNAVKLGNYSGQLLPDG